MPACGQAGERGCACVCTRTSEGVGGQACRREFKSNKKKRFKKEKHTEGVQACMDGVGMRRVGLCADVQAGMRAGMVHEGVRVCVHVWA